MRESKGTCSIFMVAVRQNSIFVLIGTNYATVGPGRVHRYQVKWKYIAFVLDRSMAAELSYHVTQKNMRMPDIYSASSK